MHGINLGRLALGFLSLWGLAGNVAAQQPAAPAEETYAQQMAREQSEHPTLKIGSPAPDFSLQGIDDKFHALAEYGDAPILAIAFISNHCPASSCTKGGSSRSSAITPTRA
jgi:hypothetical protein